MEDEELLEEFIVEANEHLGTIEDDLMAMEQAGAEADSELVNKVFRAIHSIKGAAGFLGLETVQRLSHVMENLLDKIRDGDITPNSENISVLLDGADCLKGMIDDIQNSNDVDISTLYDQLTALYNGESTASVGAAQDDGLPIFVNQDQKEAALQIADAFAWENRPSEHVYYYLLTFDLKKVEETSGKSPLTLIDDLSVTGTILASEMTTSAELDLRNTNDEPALLCNILYATLFEDALISSAVDLDDDEYQVLHIKQAPPTPAESSSKAEEETPSPTANSTVAAPKQASPAPTGSSTPAAKKPAGKKAAAPKKKTPHTNKLFALTSISLIG